MSARSARSAATSSRSSTGAVPTRAAGRRRPPAGGAGGASAGAAWAAHAEDRLQASGYRRGGARRALLELLGYQPCALTALEMEEALRAQGRRVSRASIYRILDELELLGLVKRLATGDAMARFERVRDAEGHHHHLVCDDCGVVRPFSDQDLERAIASLSARVPLAVSEHEIVLRGRCSDCAD